MNALIISILSMRLMYKIISTRTKKI